MSAVTEHMTMRTPGHPDFSQMQAGLVRVNAELNVLDAESLPEPAQPNL
jgi:hypothetical protein